MISFLACVEIRGGFGEAVKYGNGEGQEKRVRWVCLTEQNRARRRKEDTKDGTRDRWKKEQGLGIRR